MNPATLSLRYRIVSFVLTAGIIAAGILSYNQLGRLEDPEFTIKEAQVFTQYPGATAMEVAEEVTDELETAIQQLGQVKLVTSISEAGLSTIRVEVKEKYDKSTLPQVWDELRRKVGDAQGNLPPGATTSIVNDDFGDVYGIFYAVYGDGYSYAELKEHVDLLRRELLLVQDVGKIAIYGNQPEAIYAEISRARFATLGISPERLTESLRGQNLVAESGHLRVTDDYVRIQPTGEFTSVEDIGNILLLQKDSTKLYMKDVAEIRRGYVDPAQSILRFNGRPAIGLGISTVEGGNVVTMGQAIQERLAELEEETPIGIELGKIAVQSDAVTTAINGFIVSLAQAVAIVVGVLILAMGMRSALLIGAVLVLTVLATFVAMKTQGVMLERISLGALVIALGMLVDNAIVVVEGILVKSKEGMTREEAGESIVSQTMWPLFGATIVAILAFAAIGVSQDSTGEYCRSLFQVILYSLTLSWILGITTTPLFGSMFLRVKDDGGKDPYGSLLFRGYRAFLEFCIRNRWVTVLAMVGLLFAAVHGWGKVENSFFPPSTRPQFMLHYWLPQGTHIKRTEDDLAKLEKHLLEEEGDLVTNVATFVGQGALRFLLTYTPEERNSAYGLMLIEVNDYTKISELQARVQEHLDSSPDHTDALAFSRQFMLGPGDPSKIHVRLRGRNPDILRKLAAEVKAVIREEPTATDLVDDWRHRATLLRPQVAETQARNAGITRSDVAFALEFASEGVAVGYYREMDDLLPIIARSPQEERDDAKLLVDTRIWSPVAEASIPLSQIVLDIESSSENQIIRRRNRLPCLTVKCDPKVGNASTVFEKIRPKIQERYDELQDQWGLTGYSLEWGGEYEDSADAQKGLAAQMPVVAAMMVLTVIFLFNSIRLPMIIFLTVPLSIIGVSLGLLVTRQPFGFMALLGFLSLVGMLIKNAIVLIDEINAQMKVEKDPFKAVVNSGVSRLRPVSMAALTTVLGMIPLLADAFFVAMAVTIMFGLTFATILTLVVVPVLYACFFNVPNPGKGNAG